jgi:hypothetical protein
MASFTAAAASAWTSPRMAPVIDLASAVIYVTSATWLLLRRLSQ